jgi:hypothetical protein
MKLEISTGSLSTASALAACVLWTCVVQLAGPALATEVDMARLPVTDPNLCLSCHLVVQPTPASFELNPFGVDYLANGRLWDANLANLDSDGDGCLNGVEVGDSDGDGEPDGNVDSQAGNPGIPDDCGSGSLVDEKTWGALKAMFDGD